MSKPTIVANSKEAVEIMAADAMPTNVPAVMAGKWVVFFPPGSKEPETWLIAEVETQAEINRQAEERRRRK